MILSVNDCDFHVLPLVFSRHPTNAEVFLTSWYLPVRYPVRQTAHPGRNQRGLIQHNTIAYQLRTSASVSRPYDLSGDRFRPTSFSRHPRRTSWYLCLRSPSNNCAVASFSYTACTCRCSHPVCTETVCWLLPPDCGDLRCTEANAASSICM